MIELKDITVEYGGSRIIEKLNMRIRSNRCTAIVGKSGCGKTSLLLAIGGIKEVSSGKIYVNTDKVNGVRNRTGVILQNGGLFPWKNVYENIAVGLRARGEDRKRYDREIRKITEELGIWGKRDKFLSQLSGGERQRVAIARILVLNPDLILMDEPTSALDYITKNRFYSMFKELNQRRELTSVIATHDIEEGVLLGDDVFIMYGGKIVKKFEVSINKKDRVGKSENFYNLCREIRQEMSSYD